MRDVAVALAAAMLMMSPSYLASIAMHRLNIEISVVAIMSLALFLVGAFLLARLLRR